MAGLYSGLEIDQMIFERSHAGDQDAASFGEISNPVFERDDALGVGHAHDLILSD